AQHNTRLKADLPKVTSGLVPRSVRSSGRLADAKMGVFDVVDGKPVPVWVAQLPVAPGIPPAGRQAGATNGIARARSAGHLIVALPVKGRFVVLTQAGGDSNASADLVRRRLLIAAALALAVAFVVGWGAAYGLTFRLAGLQRAAARISMGEFG